MISEQAAWAHQLPLHLESNTATVLAQVQSLTHPTIFLQSVTFSWGEIKAQLVYLS